MTNETLETCKEHLRSSTHLLFKKISNLLIDEIQDDFGRQKVDDQIKNLMYKLRAKIERYYKDNKLSKSDLEILRPYWSDLCIQKKQEIETSIPWLAGQYEIKLINSSYSVPKVKEIESTPDKLSYGQNLLEFKIKLKTFWEKELPKQLKLDGLNPNLNKEQKQFLVRQFLMALIFDCGCGHKVDLIAILVSLKKEYSNDGIQESELKSGLVSLYAKDSFKTGYLYNYPLQNTAYASMVVGEVTLQVKQLFLTPMSLLMMIRLINIIEWETQAERSQNDKELISVLKDITEGDEKSLDQYIELALFEVDLTNVMGQLFSKKKYKLFEHLDYVRFFHQKNNLDGFTNALLKGVMNSSALPILSLEKLASLDSFKSNNNLKIKNGNLNHVLYKEEVNPSKARSKITQNLSTPNHCAVKIKNALIGEFKDRNKSEVIKQLSDDIADIRKSYEDQIFLLPKDIALLSVQICVMTWYLEQIGGIKSLSHKREIALSSLDTYKSSFVHDLFFYVVTNDLDLQVMDEDDYELMYEYILNEKSITDRRRDKEVIKNNNRQVKHDSYGKAVDNLKKFHKSLMLHFNVPRVDFLDRLSSSGLQMCRASYITPVMYDQFKNLIAVNKHLTTNQKKMLEVICMLAYRTGLRIKEILGLRLRDLVMTDLKYKTIGHDRYYYLCSNNPTFVKIEIRNNYHRHLKTENAHRAMSLGELLTQDELSEFIDLIRKKMTDQSSNEFITKHIKYPIINKILTSKDRFIFEDEFGQMISSHFIGQVTKDLFSCLFKGEPHDYSFHSFRHTAVNNLALVLRGSDELIKSWTTYTSEQIEQIKKYLLGSSDNIAGRHDVWKVLAHLIGHSSIEMTANHYLHFGSMLVGDALCSDESKVSTKITKALLPVSVFKKRINNTSQKVNELDIKEIVEKLASSSPLLQEMIYPDRFTASVAKIEVVQVPKIVDERHQLIVSYNHIVNVLSGRVDDETTINITRIAKDLASKIYANRHFQHQKDIDRHNGLDKLLSYIDKYRLGNLLLDENYLIISKLMKASFILDYFENCIRLIDARMEVHIKSEKEYKEFIKFCSKLSAKDMRSWGQAIEFSKDKWSDIADELEKAKSKKGVSLIINNKECQKHTCQKIFSSLFLACVYRRWKLTQDH